MELQEFVELIKCESTQQLIACMRDSSVEGPLTLRSAIAHPDLDAVAECKELFGADFGTICQSLIALNIDLDREFVITSPFSM